LTPRAFHEVMSRMTRVWMSQNCHVASLNWAR